MRTQPINSVERAIKKGSDTDERVRGVVGCFGEFLGESLAQTKMETKFRFAALIKCDSCIAHIPISCTVTKQMS